MAQRVRGAADDEQRALYTRFAIALDDQVKALSIQRRDQAVKGLHDEFAVAVQLFAQGSAHVGVKAGDLTGCVHHAPWWVTTFGTDFQGVCHCSLGAQQGQAGTDQGLAEVHGALQARHGGSISAQRLPDTTATSVAPAARWRKLSAPFRSMSKLWCACLTVEIVQPRRVSSATSFSVSEGNRWP